MSLLIIPIISLSFQPPKIVYILTNSAYPDNAVAFHMDLHCSPKYSSGVIQFTHETTHKILVIVAYASSEGSDKSMQTTSRVITFASCTK